jgi:hypothetical protein
MRIGGRCHFGTRDSMSVPTVDSAIARNMTGSTAGSMARRMRGTCAASAHSIVRQRGMSELRISNNVPQSVVGSLLALT